MTPIVCYYPSIGQSLFIEAGPSYNQLTNDTQYIVSNSLGFDSELTPYEFKKIYLGLYLRTGVYFNLSDWVGFNIALFSKTNITPSVNNNTFNSYFFGGDVGLTIRIKK